MIAALGHFRRLAEVAEIPSEGSPKRSAVTKNCFKDELHDKALCDTFVEMRRALQAIDSQHEYTCACTSHSTVHTSRAIV